MNERTDEEPAKFTICADGGANRFYELMRGYGVESTSVSSPLSSPLSI